MLRRQQDAGRTDSDLETDGNVLVLCRRDRELYAQTRLIAQCQLSQGGPGCRTSVCKSLHHARGSLLRAFIRRWYKSGWAMLTSARLRTSPLKGSNSAKAQDDAIARSERRFREAGLQDADIAEAPAPRSPL